MKDRKLTITIPVYERYEYFEEAILSAINQIVPVKIIVVDNASSHNKFKEFVDSLNLDNVSYFRNDNNIGLYGNWNRCIELCNTEFVMILGSDDILKENFSDIFYKNLIKYPDIELFHTDVNRFGNKVEIKINKSKMPLGYHTGLDLLKYTACNGLGIWTVAMVFSKSVFPNFKFEYTKYTYSQDWLFTYKAFVDKKMYGEVMKLVDYRVHYSGTATNAGLTNHLSEAYIYNHIKLQLKKHGIKEYKNAEFLERSVLRNALIMQKKEAIKSFMQDKSNPFVIHLEKLLKDDFLSRSSLKIDSVIIQNAICFYFRILRKFKI